MPPLLKLSRFNSQASCYIIWNTAFVTTIFSSQLLACLHINGCRRELSKVRLDQKVLKQPSTVVKNISVLPTLFKHTSETQCFDILLDWMTIQSVSYLLSVVNNVLECAYFSLGVKKEESYLLNYWGLLYLTNRIFLKDRSCVLKYKCYCVFTGIREYQEFILEHQTNLRNTAVDPGTSKSGCGR